MAVLREGPHQPAGLPRHDAGARGTRAQRPREAAGTANREDTREGNAGTGEKGPRPARGGRGPMTCTTSRAGAHGLAGHGAATATGCVNPVGGRMGGAAYLRTAVAASWRASCASGSAKAVLGCTPATARDCSSTRRTDAGCCASTAVAPTMRPSEDQPRATQPAEAGNSRATDREAAAMRQCRRRLEHKSARSQHGW